MSSTWIQATMHTHADETGMHIRLTSVVRVCACVQARDARACSRALRIRELGSASRRRGSLRARALAAASATPRLQHPHRSEEKVPRLEETIEKRRWSNLGAKHLHTTMNQKNHFKPPICRRMRASSRRSGSYRAPLVMRVDIKTRYDEKHSESCEEATCLRKILLATITRCAGAAQAHELGTGNGRGSLGAINCSNRQ
eukprot:3684422-Pleurochrysis_carterae.AAC.1